jgi:hypothetical protein
MKPEKGRFGLLFFSHSRNRNMESAENNKEAIVKKPKRRSLKIVLWVLALLAFILIVGVVFAVPAYVSSESCRRLILAKANAGGAGVVDFADLSMSWGKGISVSKLSFRDKNESVSVAVKEFSTRPMYGALLSGNLSFGETVIDEPKVEINVEKMKGKTEGEKTRAGSPRHEQTGLPIGRIDLVVKNGDVKVKGGEGEVEVSQINSRVDLRPEGQKSNFEIGAKVAGGGPGAPESSINARGEVKPGKGWDLKKTSGDVTVEVNNLSMSQLESLLAIAGVDMSAKGVISANLKGAMKDGVIESIAADVKGSALEITAPQLTLQRE